MSLADGRPLWIKLLCKLVWYVSHLQLVCKLWFVYHTGSTHHQRRIKSEEPPTADVPKVLLDRPGWWAVASVTLASSTTPMDEDKPCLEGQLRLLKKSYIPARRLRVFLHVGSGHLHLWFSMYILSIPLLWLSSIVYLRLSCMSLLIIFWPHAEQLGCNDNTCLFWN